MIRTKQYFSACSALLLAIILVSSTNTLSQNTCQGIHPAAEAWNNKGVVLYTQGKLQEAMECFNKAIELTPEYAEA